MKKGITLSALLVTIAIMLIFATTVTVSGYNVLNDSKKLKFATEVSYITEALDSYYTTNQSLPIGESITVDLSKISAKSLSQFENEEGYDSKEIILYQIDKTKLGISDTIYGNGNIEDQNIYALSKETNKVYFLKGVKVSNITYYTLTEDLKKLVSYKLPMSKTKEIATLKSTYSEISSSSTFLGMGTRSSITKVIFENTTENAPSSAVDVSATSDKSIVGWLDGTEVHIASNGSIYANANASHLFSNLTNCTEIQNLNLLNTSNVTNISYMFANCNNLTSLDVSKFDTSKVTNMSYMFRLCKKLKSLDVSKFNTSNVTSMFSMFDYCDQLTNLDVSNFDTSKVTNMGSMFNECRNLTILDLSSFDTSKVTNILAMFNYCTKLKTIFVSSSFKTTSVTSSGNTFIGSTELVGGNGTKYSSSYVNQVYARIDTAGSPGYFTSKSPVSIGEKQTLVTSDESEKYLYVTVNILDDNDIKSIKFEREILDKNNAMIYFKNNGIELQEDIIEVKEDTKGVTVYVEYNTGAVMIETKEF